MPPKIKKTTVAVGTGKKIPTVMETASTASTKPPATAKKVPVKAALTLNKHNKTTTTSSVITPTTPRAQQNAPKHLPTMTTPEKRKKASPPSPTKQKASGSPTLTVLKGAPIFGFEMYIYLKGNGEDGYLHGLKEYVLGQVEQVHPAFDALNVTKCTYRRTKNSDNIPKCGITNKYWRHVIIRYPPIGESTPQTRAEGLKGISSFLMDRRFSKYPPPKIDTFDSTDDSIYPALDDYLRDDDIKDCMEEDIDEEMLNSTFFESYTDFAKTCWAGKFVSDYARTLGFPSLKE